MMATFNGSMAERFELGGAVGWQGESRGFSEGETSGGFHGHGAMGYPHGWMVDG